MKKIALLLLISGISYGADLTATANTPNNQLYNQTYRDEKDGTNALVRDCVSGNNFRTTSSSSTLIKSGGGYLDSINIMPLCANSTAYVIADAATTTPSYTTVISTWSTTSTTPTNVPFHVLFTNGLAVNVTPSTCTATVIYR